MPFPGIYPSSFTNAHFFKQRWSFRMLKIEVMVSRCCKLRNRFMSAPCGGSGGKHFDLKRFDLFTYGGQINCLKGIVKRAEPCKCYIRLVSRIP